MKTPQKQAKQATTALPNNPRKNENVANAPLNESSKIPYSNEGLGDIFIMSKGTVNKAQDVHRTRSASKPKSSKKNNAPHEGGWHFKILDRLKLYSEQATSQVLSKQECQTLAHLFIKAIAPPAEIVHLKSGNTDEYEEIQMFENLPDEIQDRNTLLIDTINIRTSVSIGLELKLFMSCRGYKHVTPEVVNEFCLENNLPHDLFTKGTVLSHIYIKELFAQGCNPIVVVLNAHKILKNPADLVDQIIDVTRKFDSL